MARKDVRQTLYEFIAPPAIDGLSQVFTTFQKYASWQKQGLPGEKNRACAVIFIESEREERLTVGGIPGTNSSQGWKRVDYTVALQVYHHSSERNAEDAMENFDNLIDNLKDKLRSDHRFGDTNGTLVWQGAEPAIDVSYGESMTQNGTYINTWATLRFDVTEMIQA